MKRYFNILLIVVLGIVLASYTFCNRENKNQILIKLISETLSLYHYSPQTINDDFSGKVYSLYIKNLDIGKRFFTKADLKSLEEYKTKIDDEINAGSIEFYMKTSELYSANIEKIQIQFTEILSKPFDFTVNETYETDPEKTDFPKDITELNEVWRKSLKYQVLVRVADAIKIQEAAKTLPDSALKTVEQMESDARGNVLKLYNNYFKRLKQLPDIDRFSVFLNAIAGVCDPHTQYFSPQDKETFNIGISGQLEGIGAQLQETDDYIKVASIVPGSPSWLQGELQPNDIILKVAQENQAPVDLFDMRIEDAVKLIRGKKGTKVTLTVRKLDKSIMEITITRDVVILEESYAKSTIIKNGAGKKTGYIFLPQFYVNFEQTETSRVASEDVLNEIKKLKAEKVNGIVLDLRSNGGGSLAEAVKIGGLFITQGPIVQAKTNFGQPIVHNDPDPSIQYDGALVILVNEFSASASEILAAAMQDYRRAIIMGSKATFGKGTVQQVLDFDDVVPSSFQSFRPLGSLKITIQKYYRINGGATQRKGVVPDIILPDTYSEIEIGEREEEYSMPWTQVNAVKYQIWPKSTNFEKIIKAENAKIASDKDFNLLKDEAMAIKKQRDESIVTLNLAKFQNEEIGLKNKSKNFEELRNRENGLDIIPLLSDNKKLKNDTATVIRTNNWIKDLKKDVYLKEAVSVIDLINSEK